MDETKKTILIYNMRLAGYLMLNGHALLGVAPNNRDSRKLVFAFYDTDLLRDKMDEYQVYKLRDTKADTNEKNNNRQRNT